jgi:hypothetical protein
MTTFQDLQSEHEALLNRHEAPADPAQFWADVQRFIDRVRVDAEHISAPRERDQLRAILRFWASYVYDKTGSYPDTTLRPAMSEAPGQAERFQASIQSTQPPTPPPHPDEAAMSDWKPGWRTYLLAVIILLLLGGMFVWAKNSPVIPAASGRPTPAIVQPETSAPSQSLTLTWHVVTAGPSPFNPNIWVTKLELSASGGNDAYIFWVNGQRLPDISNNQFTVESQGCQPVSQFIGVTSAGQSVTQELVIHPPEPNSCPK